MDLKTEYRVSWRCSVCGYNNLATLTTNNICCDACGECVDEKSHVLEFVFAYEGVDFVFVKLPSGLYVGKFPVTQSQWEIIMGYNPSEATQNEECPVDSVSWDDCKKFINKINRYPQLKEINLNFDLLTLEEWEYAASGGSKYNLGILSIDNADEEDIDKIGWFDFNSDDMTHPVGKKKPNAFGLYDMIGNVWEWTSTKKDIREIEYYCNVGGSYISTPQMSLIGEYDTNLKDEMYSCLGLRLCVREESSSNVLFDILKKQYSNLSSINKKNEELNLKNKKYKEKISELKKQVLNLNKEISTLHKKNTTLELEKENLSSNKSVLQSDINFKSRLINEIKQQNIDLNKTIKADEEKFNYKLQIKDQKIAFLKEKLLALSAIEKKENVFLNSDEELKRLQDKLRENVKGKKELGVLFEELKKQYAGLQQENTNLILKGDATSQDLFLANEKIKTLVEKTSKLNQQNNSLNESLDLANNKISELNLIIQSLESENNELNKNLSASNIKLGELEKTISLSKDKYDNLILQMTEMSSFASLMKQVVHKKELKNKDLQKNNDDLLNQIDNFEYKLKIKDRKIGFLKSKYEECLNGKKELDILLESLKKQYDDLQLENTTLICNQDIISQDLLSAKNEVQNLSEKVLELNQQNNSLVANINEGKKTSQWNEIVLYRQLLLMIMRNRYYNVKNKKIEMESIDLVTKYDTLLEKTIKLEQEKKDEKILSEKQLNDLNNKYNNLFSELSVEKEHLQEKINFQKDVLDKQKNVGKENVELHQTLRTQVHENDELKTKNKKLIVVLVYLVLCIILILLYFNIK